MPVVLGLADTQAYRVSLDIQVLLVVLRVSQVIQVLAAVVLQNIFLELYLQPLRIM